MTRLAESSTISNRASVVTDAYSARHGHDALELKSPFPLLLALGDDDSAPAAIRLTQALAREKGAQPTVLRALGEVRPDTSSPLTTAGAFVHATMEPGYVDACRTALETHVAMVAGPVQWPIEVDEFPPIDAILERVRGLDARLVVMGLRRHGVLRRLISRDLLAEVLRGTRVPVLAVRPEIAALPRRVVVAVDFEPSSIRAAYLARQLLAENGSMCLVHVAPRASEDTRMRLEQLIDDLAPTPGMSMTSILLHGDIQGSIEAFTQVVRPDLLAVGSEHLRPLERLAGSISMKLAHTAPWSMLIVPALRDA